MDLRERGRRFIERFRRRHVETPIFSDAETGMGFVKSGGGEQVIRRWLEEHGREPVYSFDVKQIVGNETIPDGLYAETNFTVEELNDSSPLGYAHIEVFTHILLERGLMRMGQMLITTESGFRTPEEYFVMKLDVIDAQ